MNLQKILDRSLEEAKARQRWKNEVGYTLFPPEEKHRLIYCDVIQSFFRQARTILPL